VWVRKLLILSIPGEMKLRTRKVDGNEILEVGDTVAMAISGSTVGIIAEVEIDPKLDGPRYLVYWQKSPDLWYRKPNANGQIYPFFPKEPLVKSRVYNGMIWKYEV
jgi:hypothetical protein